MEIQHLNKNILFGAFAKACSDFGDEGGNVGGGECFADDVGIGCPFDNEDEELGCNKIRPSHWREVFEGEDKPEEKETGSWKVGDIVEVKNERDGKWYPGKILLIDKTSTPFFVQSEFGFKESSRLTNCLWCSEEQIRKLGKKPEPEFHFGDKVRIAGKECETLKGLFAFSESEDGGWFMVEGYRVLVFTKFKYVKAGWE